MQSNTLKLHVQKVPPKLYDLYKIWIGPKVVVAAANETAL